MTSKFEQLIEYVINDEEAKAKELFHDIVVEKSREIYENLMNEESDAEEDDHAERAADKVKDEIEYDDAKDKKERADESEEDDEDCIEEDMDDTSGSASQDLMREVETDEQGMTEESDAEFDDEAEEDGEDLTHDMEHDHDAEDGDIENRVVDLEDKLDELMAEFESLMGDEGSEDEFDMEPVDGEVGGDAYADDDTSEFQDMPMSENISLAKVAAPTHGDNGANSKSPVAANSGAAGMAAKPVRNTASETNPDGTSAYKAPTSYADKGRGNLPGAGQFKNVPAKNGSKLEAAPKPKFDQGGQNTRTPFPKG